MWKARFLYFCNYFKIFETWWEPVLCEPNKKLLPRASSPSRRLRFLACGCGARKNLCPLHVFRLEGSPRLVVYYLHVFEQALWDKEKNTQSKGHLSPIFIMFTLPPTVLIYLSAVAPKPEFSGYGGKRFRVRTRRLICVRRCWRRALGVWTVTLLWTRSSAKNSLGWFWLLRTIAKIGSFE